MSLYKTVYETDNLLSEFQYRQLHSYATALSFADNPSFVFNIPEEKNEIDESVRLSKTVIIKDQQLDAFIAEKLLPSFMITYPELLIKPARDYVTFIQYQKGGFFDWHTDFEKVAIQGPEPFKEMHLLFCIEGAEEGGELLIDGAGKFFPPRESRNGKVGMTPNHAVIFDKTLKHSGAKVIKGRKTILAIDVFVTATAGSQDMTRRELDQFGRFEVGEVNIFTARSRWASINKLVTNSGIEGLAHFLDLRWSYGEDTRYSTASHFHAQYTSHGCFYFSRRGQEDVDNIVFDDGKVSVNGNDPIDIADCDAKGLYVIDIKPDAVVETVMDGVFEEFRFVRNNLCTITPPTGGIPWTKKIEVEPSGNVESADFTFHCNETNYETLDVKYTYGVMRPPKLI